jgi:hypothetical protein
MKAYELQDMIIEQAKALHGPWPAGMTLFVFDDAYGWTANISRRFRRQTISIAAARLI